MPQEVGDARGWLHPQQMALSAHVYSEKFQVRSDKIFSNPSSFLLGVLQIRSISSLQIQSTWHPA
jgi:hypothetical protein